MPGLAAYAAVLIASFGLLFQGLGALRGGAPPPRLVMRAYLAAAYSGLVLHTLLYAAFLEDPITWTLLAAGIVLARRSRYVRRLLLRFLRRFASPAAASSSASGPGRTESSS